MHSRCWRRLFRIDGRIGVRRWDERRCSRRWGRKRGEVSAQTVWVSTWGCEVGVLDREDDVVTLGAGVDVGVLTVVRSESVIAEERDTEE